MAKKTKIPKKPVKVSKRKKTLPTEIDWGKGIPKDRLRYINAQEEELIRRHRSTSADRQYGGVRAYADDSASSNGTERQPGDGNPGYDGGTDYNAGTTYSGNTLGGTTNNGYDGDYGGSGGGFGDGGDSGSGIGGTGGFGDGGDSGGASVGAGISSGPQGGVVSQSNAAAPDIKGITAAAGPSGGITGLGGGSAEGLFKQTESGLRSGIGGIGDGRITAGNIVSTTAPNYNNYTSPSMNNPAGVSWGPTGYAQQNLRGPLGPNGELKGPATGTTGAYQTAQIAQGLYSKYDNQDTAKVADFMGNVSRALPGETFMKSASDVADAAQRMRDLGNISINQGLNVSMDKVTGGIDTLSHPSFQKPSGISMGLSDMNSPEATLARQAMVDAMTRPETVTTGARYATNFTAPGTPLSTIGKGTLQETGRTAAGRFGLDPSYEKRTLAALSEADKKLGTPAAVTTSSLSPGVAEDVKTAFGQPSTSPPSMDASNPYGIMGLSAPITGVAQRSLMNSLQNGANALYNGMTSLGSTISEAVMGPEEDERSVPPGHWKREEDNYLTQLGTLQNIQKSQRALAGYNAMQNPDGSGLRIGGTPTHEGALGTFNFGNQSLNVGVDQAGIQEDAAFDAGVSYDDMPDYDLRNTTDYGESTFHELGHAGSWAAGDTASAEDEEINQRLEDYKTYPPGTVLHDDAGRFLARAGKLPDQNIATGETVIEKTDFGAPGGINTLMGPSMSVDQPTFMGPTEADRKKIVSDKIEDQVGIDVSKASYGRLDSEGFTMPDGSYKSLSQVRTEMEANGMSEDEISDAISEMQDKEAKIDQSIDGRNTTMFKNDQTWTDDTFGDISDSIPEPTDPTEAAQKIQRDIAAAIENFQNPDVAAQSAGLTANQGAINGAQTVMQSEGVKPFMDNRLITGPNGRTIEESTLTDKERDTLHSWSRYDEVTANPPVYTPPDQETVLDVEVVPEEEGVNGLIGDEAKKAAKKAGLPRNLYTREDFLNDPEWLGLGTGPIDQAEITPNDAAKVVSHYLSTRYPDDYKPYITPSERDRLIATGVTKGVIGAAMPGPGGMMIRGTEKALGVEKPRHFLGRPSWEQDKLYELAGDANERYGRTQFAEGNRQGGGDPATQLGTPDQTAILYAQWANGINIPNKGDPEYQAYIVWRNSQRDEANDNWGWGEGSDNSWGWA